ncbi:hypothetical protein T07_8623 [Trichinella nelsoni]|uniref:Uncharacterized protein n=1 Tax=Trichinella nelsoni TaxID=6336 RepID=A0A0V0RT31_9BILA|nr:hypothetical protein T07_8623 [Trichinella nelsoni]
MCIREASQPLSSFRARTPSSIEILLLTLLVANTTLLLAPFVQYIGIFSVLSSVRISVGDTQSILFVVLSLFRLVERVLGSFPLLAFCCSADSSRHKDADVKLLLLFPSHKDGRQHERTLEAHVRKFSATTSQKIACDRFLGPTINQSTYCLCYLVRSVSELD